MNNPTDKDIQNDVLQAHEHTMLTSEEVAKAVARHKRLHPEHPENPGKNKRTGSSAKMQKSSPNR